MYIVRWWRTMIKVLSVNKVGRKIKDYTCEDDKGNKANLTKEVLAKYIKAGSCVNAKSQTYNGNIIIRVDDTVKENKQANVSDKNTKSISSKNVKSESGQVKRNIGQSNGQNMGRQTVSGQNMGQRVGGQSSGQNIVKGNTLNLEQMFIGACNKYGVVPTRELMEEVVGNNTTMKLVKRRTKTKRFGIVNIVNAMKPIAIDYRAEVSPLDVMQQSNDDEPLSADEIEFCTKLTESNLEARLLGILEYKFNRLCGQAGLSCRALQREGKKELYDLEKNMELREVIRPEDKIKKVVDILNWADKESGTCVGWSVRAITTERVFLNRIGGSSRGAVKDRKFTEKTANGDYQIIQEDDMTDEAKKEYNDWVVKLRDGYEPLKHADSNSECVDVDGESIVHNAVAVYNFRGSSDKDIQDVMDRVKADMQDILNKN